MNPQIAQRIKRARLLNCLSQQELAEALGISKQMVSRYEKGDTIPASQKLIQLANLFEVKVDFFFQTLNLELGEIRFRKKSTLSQKRIASIKEQIRTRLEHYLWIENLLGIDFQFESPLKHFNPKNLGDLEEAALKIRRAWDIGTDPIFNLIQMLENQEIKVIELTDIPENFDGLATFADDKYPVIVLNGAFPVERKRFTLMHELGHLLLNLSSFAPKEEEKFCNRFAGEMLFPKPDVIREFGGIRREINLQELIAIQKKYGLSIQAIVYRLVDCGVFNQRQHAQFYKMLKAHPDLQELVDASRFETPERSDRFEQLVYRALAQEDISISKAASLLDQSISLVKETALIHLGAS
ncbi:XRE family transcriptional regulator [Pontibacter sp. G13]|uniref:helix-turn-helix domain-containing protein n=1 Tax=Pontibacter sp. G13 TaxID=3074898 RepID=UPI00288BA1A2|nr:XRE family transcriptional regulator [Pontibacter sp. G13]WNJ21303.1 XRE family transcriptional regulator [Pontibacter sp. G13]